MRQFLLTAVTLSALIGCGSGCSWFQSTPDPMGPRVAPADKERSVQGVRSHYGITEGRDDDQ